MKHAYLEKGEGPIDTCIVNLIDARGILDFTGFVVSRVVTRESARGRGLARRAMARVLADADDEGVDLHLEINPYGDMTYEQLVAWYKRLGFEFTTEGFMTRKPRNGPDHFVKRLDMA